MNPFTPWWGLYEWPLSGNVAQDISQFEFNFSGTRQIEAEVVANVASYGKQLGKLTEAVLELANGNNKECVEILDELSKKIDKVKKDYTDKLEIRIREDLDKLQEKDEEALKRLIKPYQ